MEETDKQIRIACRTCLSTGSGRVFLTNLLMEGGFFDDDLSTLEELAVRNFLVKILHKMGVYDKKDLSQQSRFVDKIFELPVRIDK